MIIVNVRTPAIEDEYDFMIDEEIVMYEVQKEIIDMITRKNQCSLKGDRERVMMWELPAMRPIDLCLSAAENNLQTGSELMIV